MAPFTLNNINTYVFSTVEMSNKKNIKQTTYLYNMCLHYPCYFSLYCYPYLYKSPFYFILICTNPLFILSLFCEYIKPNIDKYAFFWFTIYLLYNTRLYSIATTKCIPCHPSHSSKWQSKVVRTSLMQAPYSTYYTVYARLTCTVTPLCFASELFLRAR